MLYIERVNVTLDLAYDDCDVHNNFRIPLVKQKYRINIGNGKINRVTFRSFLGNDFFL